MKTVQIEMKEDSPIGCDYERPAAYYPYGTQLRLEDDMIDKLGLTGAGVGDSFTGVLVMKVTGVSSNEGESNSHLSIELQITSLGVEQISDKDVLKKLYG